MNNGYQVISMRFVNLALLLFAAITCPAYARRHSLEIKLLSSESVVQPGVPTWKVGTPVTVFVRMINHTGKVVRFGMTNPAWDYQMDVRDGFGRPVSETGALRKLKEDLKNGPEFVLRSMSVTLKPDQTASDTIEVSYYYKLDRAGQYSIRVRRKFPHISNKPVKSNRLTLMLVP